MTGTLIALVFWVLLPSLLWVVWREDRAAKRDAASVHAFEAAREAMRQRESVR